MMIVAAAFVPGTPLLVPVAGAAAPDAAITALRSAATAAVEGLVAARPDRLLVLGAGPRSAVFSPVAEGTLAGFGLDVTVHLGSPACGATEPLPTSLTLGAWALREAVGARSGALGVSCAPDVAGSPAAAELLGLAAEGRVGLLVVADGAERFPPLDGPGHTADDIATSARRSDEVDAALARALADGDGDALAALADPPELVSLVSAPAWRTAGSLLAGPGIGARLLHRDASHGVGWLVAAWTLCD